MSKSLQSMFRALSIRNYRLYFTGQGISLIGTWIQRTTMAWYVYRLTDSLLLLGLLGFLSQIPSVLISPFAGVWADRWNRHKLLLMTQISALIQATILAIVVLIGYVTSQVLYPLIILSLIQGIIDAVDTPVRHSFVLDLVGEKSLVPNAIAMNSAMFNSARLIGPAIAGFLIVLFSEGVCFAINAVSHIFCILSLLLIRVEQVPRKGSFSAIGEIISGWSYAFRSVPIRYFLINLAIFTFFGMTYHVLLPAFARDVLNGNSQTLGYLMSMVGVGALMGALFLASRRTIKGLNVMMVITANFLSVAMIIFAFSQILVLSMFLMLVVGLGMMFQMASTNMLLQSIVADVMRGRVLSLYTMAFMSISPLGSIAAGSFANRFGVNWTMAITGLICLIWSAYTFRILPLIIRSIQKMLVMNHNQSMYRLPRWIPELRMMR